MTPEEQDEIRAGRLPARLQAQYELMARRQLLLLLVVFAIVVALSVMSFFGTNRTAEPVKRFSGGILFTLAVGVACLAGRRRPAAMLRDAREGRVEHDMRKLNPFSPATLRARHISVGRGDRRVWIHGVRAGVARELLSQGGTFRLHYLPRSRHVVFFQRVNTPH
jgi:hypothetical protein